MSMDIRRRLAAIEKMAASIDNEALEWYRQDTANNEDAAASSANNWKKARNIGYGAAVVGAGKGLYDLGKAVGSGGFKNGLRKGWKGLAVDAALGVAGTYLGNKGSAKAKEYANRNALLKRQRAAITSRLQQLNAGKSSYQRAREVAPATNPAAVKSQHVQPQQPTAAKNMTAQPQWGNYSSAKRTLPPWRR